jgi:hypothetical protein
MIGGGVPSEHEVEKLDPKTRGTMIANFMQTLTGKPYSADNPEFVKNFESTIQRERGTALDELNGYVAKAQYSWPNLLKQDPKGFFGIAGVKQSDFSKTDDGSFVYEPKIIGKKAALPGDKESGTAIAAPASSTTPDATAHPQASAAETWANSHPNDPRAKIILDRLRHGATGGF